MAQLDLNRGANDKVLALPLVDGQLLVGYQSDNKAALYIDATVNGKVVRFTVGSSSTDYSSQISSLASRVSALESSIEANTDATLLEITEDVEENNGE